MKRIIWVVPLLLIALIWACGDISTGGGGGGGSPASAADQTKASDVYSKSLNALADAVGIVLGAQGTGYVNACTQKSETEYDCTCTDSGTLVLTGDQTQFSGALTSCNGITGTISATPGTTETYTTTGLSGEGCTGVTFEIQYSNETNQCSGSIGGDCNGTLSATVSGSACVGEGATITWAGEGGGNGGSQPPCNVSPQSQ